MIKIRKSAKGVASFTTHDESNCIAMGKKCHKCKKLNHFSRVCTANAVSENTESVNAIEEILQDENDPDYVGMVSSQVKVVPQDFHGTIGIDTCASTCVFNSKDYLSEVFEKAPSICLANNTLLVPSAKGIAYVKLMTIKGEFIKIKVVANIIEDAKFNLLSVKSLVDNNLVMKLNKHGGLLTKSSLKEKPNYMNTFKTVKLNWRNGLLVCSANILAKPSYLKERETVAFITNKMYFDYERIHKRSGHQNPLVLEKTYGLKAPEGFECRQCLEMNTFNISPKQSLFLKKVRNGRNIYDELHGDILTLRKDRNNIKYHLILIDIKSRRVFCESITNIESDEVINKFRQVFVTIQKHPLVMLLDRQPAFRSAKFKQFTLNVGIDLVFTSPRQHQTNGTAERVIRTLKQKTTALLNDGKLTPDFNSEALKHAVYLYNRSYHSGIKDVPFNVYTGRKLTSRSLKFYKRFGSTVFYDQGTKLGVYLGRCQRSVTGTCLIYSTTKNIIRRNYLACRFDETLLTRNKMPELEPIFMEYKNLTVEDIESFKVKFPVPEQLIGSVKEAEAPTFYHEIKSRSDSNDWIEGMKKEVTALEKTGTYKLINKEDIIDEDILPSRFVFNKKRDGRKKARLVAGGHKQVVSIFSDTDGSPTATTEALYLLLSDALKHNKKVGTLDFDVAYLNSILPRRVLMNLPPAFLEVNKAALNRFLN